MKRISGLLFAALLLTVPCGQKAHAAGEVDNYWLCAAPGTNNPVGSWCPQSTTYPAPVSVPGSGTTGIATPPGAVNQGATVGGNLTGMIACGSTAVYDASTNGTTKLVSKVTGQKIYICGYTLFAAGVVSVNLEYGTQTTNPCDTGETKLTPAFQLVGQTGVADEGVFYRGMSSAVTTDLCLKTNAGQAVQAIVYYTQF